MIFTVIIIIAITISVIIAWFISSFQNKIIGDCLNRKRKHDKLLTGELYIQDISNTELIALSHPLWTHIGMGGVGPRYNPSFAVFCLIVDELSRRRELSCLRRINEQA